MCEIPDMYGYTNGSFDICYECGSGLRDNCHAEVHTFYGNDLVCVVCMRPGMDSINAALTLSHEALHIFRRWCKEVCVRNTPVRKSRPTPSRT
jgi:hypothetical protein